MLFITYLFKHIHEFIICKDKFVESFKTN